MRDVDLGTCISRCRCFILQTNRMRSSNSHSVAQNQRTTNTSRIIPARSQDEGNIEHARLRI